jgi:hypothetical protein
MKHETKTASQQENKSDAQPIDSIVSENNKPKCDLFGS